MRNALIMTAVIAIAVLLSRLAKKQLAERIMQAMERQDNEQARRLLFSGASTLLLNHDSLFLMRANVLMIDEKADKALCYWKMINPQRLDLEQRLNYIQMQIGLVMAAQDGELFDQALTSLMKMKDGKQDEVIDQLLKQDQITRKLHFMYDRSVIEDIITLLDRAEGTDRGLLYLSLAKAYHLDQQAVKTTEALKKAEKILKGTGYEDSISLAMRDPSVLD